ncbi:hypothetical protein [Spirosoma fluminis]
MEPIVKTYTIKVIRVAGHEPNTGKYFEYAEQEFAVDAASQRSAYELSHLVCEIPFRGQIRRTFINGEEYFDEKY